VITLRAIVKENNGDEVIVFAPFFPEYKVFVESVGAKLVVLQSDEKTLLPDFDAFEKALNPKTKAVIINTPNNPSGVAYNEQTIAKICEVLKSKSKQFGAPMYLISDEPYRELVYDATTKTPSVLAYYDNSFVCYSYSKSLSLPGERVGYIAVSPTADEAKALYAAVCGAGRILGFVCAPALFQRVAAECDGLTSDLEVYKRNRDLLYNGLTASGYECIYPDGAFYLFVKALEEDAAAFCKKARGFELLLVDGGDFGAPGWVRVAYCVPTERIERALPLFKKLAESY
jgi:aspartate aminotransferase